MRADTSPLKTIFGKELQYVVPLYQRPYVWREETHWAPLWADLLSVVRQVAASADAPTDDIAPHFLGAVVLEQKPGPTKAIERRQVIDGQQRLTTLQLVIAAGARAAAEAGAERESRQLRRLVRNDDDFVTEETDAFKIWPTNVDRKAFVAVMNADGESTERASYFTLIQDGYEFFLDRFREELRDIAPPDAQAWMAATTDAIRNHLQLVVIDLEDRDNPQVIFETLNARGTPLLAIDLVKNLLFLKAQQEGDDVEFLYKEHWRTMERTYWREGMRQGRLSRPRAEVFLMHWLTMKRRQETQSHQLYNSFRPLAESGDQSSASLLREFVDDAATFEGFGRCAPGTPEQRFFTTLAALDTRTVLPLVMALYKAPISDQDRRIALTALESWLVRRALGGLTGKNYNRFVVELLSVIAQDAAAARHLLLGRLRSAEADTNRWPNDEELVTALTQYRFYGRLSNAVQQLVLRGIEDHLRTDKNEGVTISGKLTVEHVLPQKWRDHWPTDPPGDPVTEAERDARVHRLGNLTLVTGPLNIPMSNGPWPDKRSALDDHSLLVLNKRLVAQNPDVWTEQQIDARSAELATVAARLWPGPEAQWDVEARHSDIEVKPQVRPAVAAVTPAAEDLIDAHASPAAAPLFRSFLDEISFWEGVSVKVGKAAGDRWRRIFFHRKGSPYGAFARIFPSRGAVRFRLDIDEVPFARRAEALNVQDPYRVRILLESEEDVAEALALARRSWDAAVPEPE